MFSKLFGRRKPPAPEFSAPRPDHPVEIVGDVHGCARLIDALPPPETGVPRIFVGDVVDRGADTRGVLDRLRAHEAAGHGLCLMGNHEAMMLSFLDDPAGRGRRWLRHGGLETIMSFELGLGDAMTDDAALLDLRSALRAALGAETEDWLRKMPLVWRSGTLAVTHAGADPRAPLDDQPERALLWGHPEFVKMPRSDGIWIAHGHTVSDFPFAEAGRISVDTGAYGTGRLTMARVEPDGGIGFVTVTED